MWERAARTSEAKFEPGEGSVSTEYEDTPHPPRSLRLLGTLSHKGRGEEIENRTPMTHPATMRLTYQITGAVLLCFAVYVGVEALELRYYSSLGPGPGFFSCWLALILGILAIAMVAEATFGRPDPMPQDFFADLGGYLRMGAVVLSLLLSALLLERIGFRLTMFALYLFLLLALGSHGWIISLAVAAAGSFGVYFVFTQWLSVPLPIGTFGF